MPSRECPYCGKNFKGVDFKSVNTQLRDHIYYNHRQQFIEEHSNLIKKAPNHVDPLKWAIGGILAWTQKSNSSEK